MLHILFFFGLDTVMNTLRYTQLTQMPTGKCCEHVETVSDLPQSLLCMIFVKQQVEQQLTVQQRHRYRDQSQPRGNAEAVRPSSPCPRIRIPVYASGADCSSPPSGPTETASLPGS